MIEETVQDRFSQSFLKAYQLCRSLHDWYLRSLYVANTGPLVQTYSVRGKSTLQMMFSTSGPEKDLLLVYRELYRFQVDFQDSGGAGVLSPTGFGRCMESKFTADKNGRICHQLIFEDGSMEIVCEGVTHRRIANDYWHRG